MRWPRPAQRSASFPARPWTRSPRRAPTPTPTAGTGCWTTDVRSATPPSRSSVRSVPASARSTSASSIWGRRARTCSTRRRCSSPATRWLWCWLTSTRPQTRARRSPASTARRRWRRARCSSRRSRPRSASSPPAGSSCCSTPARVWPTSARAVSRCSSAGRPGRSQRWGTTACASSTRSRGSSSWPCRRCPGTRTVCASPSSARRSRRSREPAARSGSTSSCSPRRRWTKCARRRVAARRRCRRSGTR